MKVLTSVQNDDNVKRLIAVESATKKQTNKRFPLHPFFLDFIHIPKSLIVNCIRPKKVEGGYYYFITTVYFGNFLYYFIGFVFHRGQAEGGFQHQ